MSDNYYYRAGPIGKVLGFRNIGDLDRGLATIVKEVEAGALAAAEAGADVVKREWKSRIRTDAYRTGAYYNSIELSPPRMNKAGDVFVDVGTDLTYPFFLEYGTRYMTARPTMMPAYEASRDKALEVAAVVLGEKVMKSVKFKGV